MTGRLLRIIAASCLIAAAGILAAAVAWFASGGRIYTVQTGSMRPIFQAGDAVLVRPIQSHHIHVGTIVTFRDRQQPAVLVTHRVVAVNLHTMSITTKGDHNPQPDLPISSSQLVGRAVMVAPGAGRLINWLRRPWSLVLVVYLPLLFFAAKALWRWQCQPVRIHYRLRPLKNNHRFFY